MATLRSAGSLSVLVVPDMAGFADALVAQASEAGAAAGREINTAITEQAAIAGRDAGVAIRDSIVGEASGAGAAAGTAIRDEIVTSAAGAGAEAGSVMRNEVVTAASAAGAESGAAIRNGTIAGSAEGSAAMASNFGKGAEESKSRITSAFSGLGGQLVQLAGFLLVADAFKTIITTTDQYREAVDRLNQTATNLHIPLDTVNHDFDAQSEKARTLGFTNIQVADSYNNLLIKTKDNGTAQTLLNIAYDLSREKHISLQEAAQKLGLAWEGNGRALRDLGFATDETKTLEQKRADILELQNRLSGQAVVHTHSLAGAVDILKASWIDNLDKNTKVNAVLSEMIKLIANNLPVLLALGAAVAGIVVVYEAWQVATKAVAVAQAILGTTFDATTGKMIAFANPMNLILLGVAALAIGFIVLYEKCKPFHDLVDKVADSVRIAVERFLEWITGTNSLHDAVTKIIKTVGDAVAKFLEWITGTNNLNDAFKVIGATIEAFFIVLGTLINYIAGTAITVVNNFTKAWNDFASTLHQLVGDSAWQTIVLSFQVVAAAGDVAFKLLIAGAAALKDSLDIVFRVALPPIMAAFQVVVATMSVAVTDSFHFMAATAEVIRAAITATWDALSASTKAIWNDMSATATAIWTAMSAFFSAIHQAISATITVAWSAISSFLNTTWNAIAASATAIWTAIKDFLNAVHQEITAIITAAWTAIQANLSAAWNSISATAQAIWSALRSFFQTLWNDLVQGFAQTATNIGTEWDRIRELAAAPVRFIVNTVYDRGIVPTWNAIAKPFGLATLSEVPFAGGGYIAPGYAPGQDTVPALLSPGEAVLTPEAAKSVGYENILALNAIASGRMPNVLGYQGGGVVGDLGNILGSIAGGGASAPATGGNAVDSLLAQGVAGIGNILNNTSFLLKLFTDPIGAIADAFANVLKAAQGFSAAGEIGKLPGSFAKEAIDGIAKWVKDHFAALFANISSGDHLAIILAALAAAGVAPTPAWISGLETLIQRESGWNPNAINLTDSNAAAGHPSQGLMQTIPSTFAAYVPAALAGLGITNPIANVAAGIRYIIARYGDISNVQQANPNLPPKGYDSGGWLLPGDLGVNQTRSPEAVLTADQWATLKSTVGGGPSRSTEIHVHPQQGMSEEAIAMAVDRQLRFAYRR